MATNGASNGGGGGAAPGTGGANAAVPHNAIMIDAREGYDKVEETIKVTEGYFTNGDGTLEGYAVWTSSDATSNKMYYYGVTQAPPASSSAATQFTVTWGHKAGSGSDTYGDSTSNPNTIKGQTQAIYQQIANMVLLPSEVTGGFMISQQGAAIGKDATEKKNIGHRLGSGVADTHIYCLFAKRERMKDRLNKKSWTLTLSGSGMAAAVGKQLKLTDDSKIKGSIATPGGPRYNIVSGAAGTVYSASTHRTFGWIYPEMGLMVFSGHELSSSIGGVPVVAKTGSSYPNGTSEAVKWMPKAAVTESVGFTPWLHSASYAGNAIQLVNSMRKVSGTSLRLRSEEDQTQVSYFCRVKAGQGNLSNNPTFVSGSKNELRNVDMRGNPQTFISGVGLYNLTGQLIAIAKLSSPLKKNFSSEATIKVKLTY